MNIEDIANKPLKSIEIILNNLNDNDKITLLKILSKDKRTSVRKFANLEKRKIDNLNKEKLRVKELFNYHEYLFETKELKNVLCIDEVGRGPLAGPVTVAGVLINKMPNILYVNDSKKVTEKNRNLILKKVNDESMLYHTYSLNNKYIDKYNILNTTLIAMNRLVRYFIYELNVQIDCVLVDGNHKIPKINVYQEAVISGDSTVYGISLASIIAKVKRDNIMTNFSNIYPYYFFEKNKGYGTKKHIINLKKYGECPIHRKTFIRKIIKY